MPEQKQFTIDYGWATETFIATQAEYDKKISDYETEKSERHSRNQYTIYEAAEVLASSNEIGGAKYFLNERMRKAVEAGYLQVSDPKDGGPLTRRCRPGSDWVTPLAIDKWLEHDGYQFRWPDPATPAPVVAASDAPAIPKNQRPDLLAPLIEKAQRGESDPFNTAVIWPKLCDMAEQKLKPFIGKTGDGLQWIDAFDDPQFMSKKALSDRLRRAKKAAIELAKPR